MDIEPILANLQHQTPGLTSVALLSNDGLIISSLLSDGLESDQVAAISAALINQGEMSAGDAMLGHMSQVIIRGENGYIIISDAGHETLLTVFATLDAKLGLILFDIDCAIQEINLLVT